MFPIGIVGKTKFRAYVAFFLIVINTLVFLWELTLQAQGQAVLVAAFRNYALNVCAIGSESIAHLARNGLFSMFLHGSVAHLFGNMLFLWLFGPRVEEFLGHRRFLIFYLLAGFGAHVAHILFGGVNCVLPTSGIVIGASGAIAGVMGAFLFLHPGAKVEIAIVLFRPFFLTRRVPAFMFLGYWFIWDFMRGIGWVHSTGIAHWAHIGGFVAGLLMVFVAALFKPVPEKDPFEHLDE